MVDKDHSDKKGDQEEADEKLPISIDEEHSGKKGQRYAVFVQWERGKPPQYEEEVISSDPELALAQAKHVTERRWDPVSVWVTSEKEITKSRPGDSSLYPSTDRSYRETAWYAQNRPEGPDDEEGVFADD